MLREVVVQAGEEAGEDAGDGRGGRRSTAEQAALVDARMRAVRELTNEVTFLLRVGWCKIMSLDRRLGRVLVAAGPAACALLRCAALLKP